MKAIVALLWLIVLWITPAESLSTLKLVENTAIDNDGNDVLFAELHDNSDTVVYVKKDVASTASDDWSFVLNNLTTGGDSRGVIAQGDPDIFYGFTHGPAQSIIYARDAGQSVGGARGLYYGFFNRSDSGLIKNNATYPAYVAGGATYNFAYVRDSGTLYVATMSSDTPSLPANDVKVFVPGTEIKALRSPKWSPDAQSLVFAAEESGDSQASIYVLKNVQSLAAAGTALNLLTDTGIARITNDTFYNAFPHFVGNDQFVLYTRANPYANFRFANFADTGGCTTVVVSGTNWDAMLYDRSQSQTWSVDTSAATSAVSSSAGHRGYILLVTTTNNIDTDGDLASAVIQTTQTLTAASSGTFYFPTNARLKLQSGAVPTCTFTVVPDTPKSVLKSDTRDGMEAVIAPVHITIDVPNDSTDKFKIEVIMFYHDIELANYVELATRGQVYDTQTRTWKSAGTGIDVSSNLVTFTAPHFSAFGVGLTSEFIVSLRGESCLVRRWGASPPLLAGARRLRDILLNSPWGRRAARCYYAI